MNDYVLALFFAIVGLVLGAVARWRSGPADPAIPLPLWLIPIGIIVGVLPWILRLGDIWKQTASLMSLLMSLAAIVLLLRAQVSRKT